MPSSSRWSCRTAAVGLVVPLILLVFGAVSADAARPASAAGRAAVPKLAPVTSCAGHPINQALPGECILISAGGFAAGEVVAARLMSAPTQYTYLRASLSGIVRWSYVVARSVTGRDVATFVGQGAAQLGTGRGNVVLTVPRIGVVRYVVRPSPAWWGRLVPTVPR